MSREEIFERIKGGVDEVVVPKTDPVVKETKFRLSDAERSLGYLCRECKMRYTNSFWLGFDAGRGLGKKEVLDVPDVGDCPKCRGQHEKGWNMGVNAGRLAGPVEGPYPNYDINPAHKEGCDCGICSGEFDKKDAVKVLKKVARG